MRTAGTRDVHASEPSSSVSGVITTYDRPEFLAAAITSALTQNLPLAELVVVDDCSPVDPKPVLAPFGERVRYVRLAANGGPSTARNAGVAAARGEIVAFLDDDDRWLPDKTERQVARLAAGYEASLCGWQLEGGHRPRLAAVDEITERMLGWGNPFCGTSGLVARRDVLLAEPFDEDLRWAEDWELYVRLARRVPLAYERRPLFQRAFGGHEGLTMAATRVPLEQLLRGASAARKQRAWLGEWRYRNAVARTLLRHLSARVGAPEQIRCAVRHAGAAATVTTVLHLGLRSLRRV